MWVTRVCECGSHLSMWTIKRWFLTALSVDFKWTQFLQSPLAGKP